MKINTPLSKHFPETTLSPKIRINFKEKASILEMIMVPTHEHLLCSRHGDHKYIAIIPMNSDNKHHQLSL